MQRAHITGSLNFSTMTSTCNVQMYLKLQYKTAYICRTHLRLPNAVAFLVYIIVYILYMQLLLRNNVQ